MDSESSIDSSFLGPVLITDYKRVARRVFGFVIFITIGIVISIFTFGANTTLIESSTSVLKVDTRNATVHDILGGIKFLPIRSSTTDVSTPEASPATTSTQVSTIPPSYYLEAKSSLENLTEILKGIDSFVTVDDFSLARIFKIHDHLYLATGGFKCWSDNSSREYMYDVSSSSDSCSSNGFLQCFGEKANIESDYYSAAYNEINTFYLSKTTSLNRSNIDYISDLWSNVLLGADESTLILNIDPQGYRAMNRLLCPDDSFRNGKGGVRKHASTPFILGICSFILAIFVILFDWHIGTSKIAFVLWFSCFGLNIAFFAVSFNSNIPAAKYINQTEGITAKTGGLLSYFVGIVILNLVALLLLLIESRKQKQAKNEAELESL